MKKSGFFRGVIDGIRSTVSQQSSSAAAAGARAYLEAEAEAETLKPSHFKISTIVQHGFPYQPTSIAFDPIQRLIAIGCKNGSLRILGRPGVDISLRHITEFAVLQIIFVINEGQLITICADDNIHLWNLRNKAPEIVHSLKFQKERISYSHLTFQSKWLYIGTERGNIYVVNIDTFTISGYVINWNKAVELNRKTHPGAIIHLSDCPVDTNKLLIGFECGSIVLWDLRNKSADFRHTYAEGILSISWHHDGRQFLCSHSDGSLSTWNLKAATRPQSSIYPHAKSGSDPKQELCSKIPKVEWRTSKQSDPFIIFSGGLNMTDCGDVTSKQVLTIIHGKSTTVLEMEHDVIDFVTLCESPYEADYNDPYAIAVLLNNDLVVVNLQLPGYPCFPNPYPMDLHESPVTYCYYLANCPPDLVHAFYTAGQKLTKRPGVSEREWPINGGEWGSSTVSYPEIIITGHADGSLKFWDASAVNLQILYKLKTAKLFEKPRLKSSSSSSTTATNTTTASLLSTSSSSSSSSAQQHQQSSNSYNNSGNLNPSSSSNTNNNNYNTNANNNNTNSGGGGGGGGGNEMQKNSTNDGQSEFDDLFAIEHLTFSAENRVLCVGGSSSQVIVFRFNKQEAQSEVTVIEVPMNYDEIDSQQDNHKEILSGASSLLYKPSQTNESQAFYSLKVRSGYHKRLSGFQAEIICLSPWIDRQTPPYRITSMAYNLHASLLAYGTENSLIIIDLVQKSIVLNVSTTSLYGTSDPYQRNRPKRCTSAGPHSVPDHSVHSGTVAPSTGNNDSSDRCHSPIPDNNEKNETCDDLGDVDDSDYLAVKIKNFDLDDQKDQQNAQNECDENFQNKFSHIDRIDVINSFTNNRDSKKSEAEQGQEKRMFGSEKNKSSEFKRNEPLIPYCEEEIEQIIRELSQYEQQQHHDTDEEKDEDDDVLHGDDDRKEKTDRPLDRSNYSNRNGLNLGEKYFEINNDNVAATVTFDVADNTKTNANNDDDSVVNNQTISSGRDNDHDDLEIRKNIIIAVENDEERIENETKNTMNSCSKESQPPPPLSSSVVQKTIVPPKPPPRNRKNRLGLISNNENVDFFLVSGTKKTNENHNDDDDDDHDGNYQTINHSQQQQQERNGLSIEREKRIVSSDDNYGLKKNSQISFHSTPNCSNRNQDQNQNQIETKTDLQIDYINMADDNTNRENNNITSNRNDNNENIDASQIVTNKNEKNLLLRCHHYYEDNDNNNNQSGKKNHLIDSIQSGSFGGDDTVIKKNIIAKNTNIGVDPDDDQHNNNNNDNHHLSVNNRIKMNLDLKSMPEIDNNGQHHHHHNDQIHTPSSSIAEAEKESIKMGERSGRGPSETIESFRIVYKKSDDYYAGLKQFRLYGRHKIIDLRNDSERCSSYDLQSSSHHNQQRNSFFSFSGSIFHKIDSFTRSRSSSTSSLENVGSESIQSLVFANTYVLKTETMPNPTLWVGTSCGTVVAISLTMPESMDNRVLCLQAVLATPSPTVFRLKGAILNIGFLDINGSSLPAAAESWKENKRNDPHFSSSSSIDSSSKRAGSLTTTRTSSSGGSGTSGTNSISPGGSGSDYFSSSSTQSKNIKTSPISPGSDCRDSHLLVITSEKQIRLMVMPQQICAQKATITETSFAVRADLVYIKNQDAHCLAIYLGTGNIVVYSLPSLRILIDNDFLPLTDVSFDSGLRPEIVNFSAFEIARTILFSVNGHGMFLSSPTELTKFTILSSFSDNLPDMLGSIYIGPKELPEPPKQSFLKGFFGGTPTPLDRDELFGESNSGRASKTMARLIPGSMEHSKAQTSNLGGEFGKLREGFTERGERLGRLEDSTARMQNEAEAFSSMAHAVMLKYRDKKWYQF